MNRLNLWRYQYKGFWIRVFIDITESQRFNYVACVELPRSGIIQTTHLSSKEEAEFAAEEIIDSWN
ncbi:hypothetical protein IQ230_13930 [Gloeocapsopsis crepidinum LEGE 06123]|uniref:HicB-like antitoxin of toxin-antitoxin system domain-containing protein n=1 Tax=Gloeocapsopsis crepidinum LEGE 06123 TaxID=588587 RepID=A0ABR9UT28_9CHRO|nr:hypothetical protein [Gloeocapsopsis crepidinum]MBE9191426.1 hypothetical protein [Gloeocapsopsis crepidinum LEGE 06123]